VIAALAALVASLRRPAHWPIFVVLAGLMLWARFGAPALNQASFDSLAEFASPYSEPLPAGPAGQPLAEQVVIVVIDGLRLDASRQMPALNRLRAQGADRVLSAGQPALSMPGWTAIGTGAWPEQSGITSNFTAKTVVLDTLFTAAQREGLTTALVGGQAWHQLYGRAVDIRQAFAQSDLYPGTEQAAVLSGDRAVTALALDALRAEPNLVIIHLLGPDTVAHYRGAVGAAYAESVANADEQLAAILAALDLQRAALLVTADHGHLDQGGHGGREPVVLRVPLVAAGRGIRPGQYPDAEQIDIAPTVAVLLGSAIPAHNQGSILLDQIDAPEAVQATRAVDLARQLAARHAALLRAIGDPREPELETLNRAGAALAAGRLAEARALAAQSNALVRGQWRAAQAERLNRERLARLPLALLLFAPVALYAWWWRRAGWPWRAPLAAALLYFVIWNAAYFLVQGYRHTISMINSEASGQQLLVAALGDALLALAAASALLGVLRRNGTAGGIARDAANTLFLVAAGLEVQILSYYVVWDVVLRWHIGDLDWAFKYYMDVVQTAVFWPVTALPVAVLAPMAALLAAATARWAARLPLGRPRLAGPSAAAVAAPAAGAEAEPPG
jgi:hypothetical protein